MFISLRRSAFQAFMLPESENGAVASVRLRSVCSFSRLSSSLPLALAWEFTMSVQNCRVPLPPRPGVRLGVGVRELQCGPVDELAAHLGVDTGPVCLVRLGLEVVLGVLFQGRELLGHLLPVGDGLTERVPAM
ncbi:hypothetical protein [Streptomyces sp. NPDC020362]|uniref:hypothetical protein n=1 Tax=Streptomyces sp. NPDC020362 TaxID=3154486 RepID=UPI0033ED85F9